ncbi:MAG: YdcF family protein [Pseudomonadota bacterium]
MRYLAITAAAVAALWVAGFGWFLATLPAWETSQHLKADGLAVLTGGQGTRIKAGARLLADGAAPRMLISGVGPDVSDSEIMKIARAEPSLFGCCIALGREAASTIGNAHEIAAWAGAHDMNSLIVVTSDYHMPRSLALLRDRLPDADLVAYPTSAPWGSRSIAWARPRYMFRIATEYNKYLATRARLAILS